MRIAIRGPLFEVDYRPLFSGHQTFPLRYGWLKKAYDAVEGEDHAGNKAIFLSDDAISRFGVGKNMVAAIRHWATACGVIAEGTSRRLTVTSLGRFLFGTQGVDPYLENPASLWLLHWNLCSGSNGGELKTTWYWAFNYFNRPVFRREDLVDGLITIATGRGWSRVSQTTLKRDVECFVRCYESRPPGRQGAAEDCLESVLAELGLIRGLHGQFQFVRGPKRSLPNEVFAYALCGFWNAVGVTSTLSFEAIAHEPGSPGRVFLLDEADLADRLLAIEDVTDGALRWSETAGLKQVLRSRELTRSDSLGIVQRAFSSLHQEVVLP